MKKLVNDKRKKIGRVLSRILSFFYHTEKKDDTISFYNLKNIIIVDFFMIGDLVMGIPFYKILRKQCPNASITLVCQKWSGEIIGWQNLVDEIIEFDGKKVLHDPFALVSNFSLFRKTIRSANKKKYDLAIEPRGDIRNIFFMRHIASNEYVSFNYSGGECMLSRVLIPNPKIDHVLDDKLNVLEQLGLKIAKNERVPNLKIPRNLQQETIEYLNGLGISDSDILIAINPGASLKIKQWKKFPELVQTICNKFSTDHENNVVFLVFGVEDDRTIIEEIVNIVKKNGIRGFVVIENLALYISLISRCHCMLCNDSSAGHIAASFNIPVVVIFGPVEPSFAEPRSNNIVTSISKSMNCKPCFMSQCPYDNRCIENITVKEVKSAFDNIWNILKKKQNGSKKDS